MEKIIYEKDQGDKQLKVEISHFKDKYYLNFRWWYLSYDEGYLPSDDGVNIPFDYETIKHLVNSLSKYLTVAELEVILDERKNSAVLEKSQ